MHQVTAIFQNAEVGYGEGERLGYAVEECLESIPEIISGSAGREEISLLIIYPDGRKETCNIV